MDYENNYGSLGPGFEPDPPPKVRIPLWVLLFVAGSLILAGIAMVRFPKVFSEYRIYVRAEDRIQDGELTEALTDLMSVVETHPNSVPVIIRMIDLSMETGYYDLAGYVFDEYLVGKDLTDSQYSRMMSHQHKLEKYYATYDVMAALTTEAAGEEEVSEAEAAAIRADVRESLSPLLEDPDMDQAMVCYFYALFSETTKDRYDWLQRGYREDPECFDLRVQLGNTARTMGDLESARQYLNEAYARDHKDFGALRGMAVLALLDGDPQAARTYAEEAYAISPEGTYVRDTYLIALHVIGDEKQEGYIRAEIEAENGSLDEDTKRFLNGECTLQEYYIE